jgi:nucleotide-binding universal stress UspA family protein
MADTEGGSAHAGNGGRVVVGVDGSDASQAALAWALEEARLRHATLEVVSSWQYPFEMAAGSFAVPAPAGEMRLWAEDVIEQALAAVEADGDVPVVRRAEYGPAVTVLMAAARGAELLVVGTRGHSRVTGLFLGSVSQYLAVHAPCPVLVVHGAREAPAPEADARSGSARVAGIAAADDSAAAGVDEGTAAATAAPRPPWVGSLAEIPEEECLALLAGKSVGRLIVVYEDNPIAFPVNYVLDGRTVAIRTDQGTKLDWGALGRVAFEVDEIDEARHQGWSVIVQGVGRDITEGIDTWSERLRSKELVPWVGGDRQHWIAIASPRITGRRILTPDDAEALSPH